MRSRKGSNQPKTRRKRSSPVLRAALPLVLLELILYSALPSGVDSVRNQAAIPGSLLLTSSNDPGLAGKPIWAQGGIQEATVALFRTRFVLPGDLGEASLSIMADTRFEVWLDGVWLGRGPARFSRVRQEYDSFSLEGLAAGPHVIAALVQYAPNVRRSESLRPALQASLQGWDGSSWQTITATDASWKAIVSPAWDANARPVSQLGLIGPMEVLDLRQLPADWMQPGFDDSTWPVAQEIEPSPFPALSPRSIPALKDVVRPPVSVVEAGLLSPGWQLVELEHPTGDGPAIVVDLALSAARTTTLRLEALESNPVSVDGSSPLGWLPLDDARRPDVLQAEGALSAGPHTLHVTVPPETACPAESLLRASFTWSPQSADQWPCTLSAGRTLAILLDGLQLTGGPGVSQTADPGRRTLLADPVSGGAGAPVVQLLADHAEVTFPSSNTPRYVVLDFGRTLHARLSLVADGPAGAIVDAGWDERLTEGRPLPNPGSLAGNLWSQVDSWVLDGTPRHLTTLDTRSGRYLILQVFGPGTIAFHQIQALEETYPVDQIGWFESSDDLLNAIWQIGVDTLVPNMTDAYTDTPWRERGQWWGDAMVAFQVNRAAFGDLELFRRGLRQMADAIDEEGRPAGMAPNGTGNMILDYGMQWLEGLHLYWTLSGDLALVEELYPPAQRLTAFVASYEGSEGLLDIPPAHWSQSAFVDWAAVSSRSGESTALNAQYAALLSQMGEMAEALGYVQQAQTYFDRSSQVETTINEVLFLRQQGCYAASRLNGEIVPPSPHAQAWALRYGVVPAEARDSVVRALIQELSPFFDQQGSSVVEPPGMAAVLEALSETARTGEALDLIRARYGELIAQGATTWWELYAPNPDRSHSLSHVWGGSPTWFLSSHVLGGVVTGPAGWRVAPHPADLAYARGAVPMGTDALEIEWQHPQCGDFSLIFTAPTATAGEVLLPIARQDALVTLDGATIWADGPAGAATASLTGEGLLIAGVTGGRHEISASFTCFSLSLPLIRR
jgi:alpha-L-rhamnosidase